MSNAWSRIPYRRRQAIKQLLLARDGLRCCNCHQPIKDVTTATIEHLVERRLGGPLLDPSNLGLAHPSCNYSRRYGRHNARSRVIDNTTSF